MAQTDPWIESHPRWNIPIIRGAVFLIDMVIVGIEALTWSANSQQGTDEQLKTSELVSTLVISFVGALVLFVGIPYGVSRLFSTPDTLGFHIIDGVARLVMFIAYIVIIGRMKEIQRVYQYHGAEHKSVYCYEAKKPLTVKNVQKFPTEHPRCGTTFLVIVVAVSIVIFTLVRMPEWYWNIGMRILLVPVIAGISYEILKLGGKYPKNPLLKLLIIPGLWAQSLTTRQPDDKQVEVAIASLKKVL